MKVSKLTYTLVGKGPIVFGAPVHEQKRDDETHEQLDERTWKQRCRLDTEGHLALSAVAVHRSLIWAAKWLSLKLSGNKTFTKRIESGMLPMAPCFPLSNGKPHLTPEDCEKFALYVPSDGKRGGTKRVWRLFPRLKPVWRATALFLVTDEALVQGNVLERHALCAGLHDGMGSMRIGKSGPNGMYGIEDFSIEPYSME